ncbi:MAG: 16S rRNA (guanine(527)-N(7))-methyltransferase RsmG [Gammaproteobacteria bacterium]|nr:16S rRNA (guanine(527)-N(7))-methyltransferase RsmG [Gammaproteobacteria bacterium]
MEDYLDLLVKWNRTYNLTAIRDRKRMVTHHILDSLSVIPLLSAKRVADLGSGAGLPGIPIALLHPEREVVMVDSNVKKSRFIQQAILELGLIHASVVHSRAEQFQPRALFDGVVSRAFSSLSQFLSLAAPLLSPGGQAIAMKGKWSKGEEERVTGYELEEVTAVVVPGLYAERHIVVYRKQ